MSRVRALAPLLLLAGPLAIGVLRFILPYDTGTNLQLAQGVYANPGRESAVLWLDLVAVLTLVPGVLIVLARTISAAPVMTRWAAALVVPAYLSLAGPFAGDLLAWSAHTSGLTVAQATALLDATHPALGIQLGIFIVGHVVGTVLLGLAVLRSRRAPVPLAWALVVSQPLHFLAAVVFASHSLDLLAWCLTALGMASVRDREVA